MSTPLSDSTHKEGFDRSFNTVERIVDTDLQIRIASLRQGLRTCADLEALLGYVEGAKRVIDLAPIAFSAAQRVAMIEMLDRYVTGVCAHLGVAVREINF